MILPFVRIVILNWPRNSLRGYIEPCRLLGKECQQEVSLEAAPLSGRSNYIWAYFSRHNRAAHQARNYFYPKKMFICSFSFFFFWSNTEFLKRFLWSLFFRNLHEILHWCFEKESGKIRTKISTERVPLNPWFYATCSKDIKTDQHKVSPICNILVHFSTLFLAMMC